MAGTSEDAREDRAPSAASGLRGRLLLIDSRPERLEAMHQALGDGYEIDSRIVGDLSLAELQAAAHDVLLIGEELLSQDATTLLAALHDPGRAHITSVVVIAADASSEDAPFLELGADDVVRPGMPPRELRARMTRTLRQTRRDHALASIARTDALTGLPNLRGLQSRLDEEFKRASRYRYELAAIVVDLDRLKAINDQHGHEAGNRAIQAFARHLKANLREVDFAARFGGDEFVVLLPHQSAAEAAVFTERLRLGLAHVRVRGADGQELPIVLTLSAGIAEHVPGTARDDAEALLRAADDALNEAKRTGRNRVVTDGRVQH